MEKNENGFNRAPMENGSNSQRGSDWQGMQNGGLGNYWNDRGENRRGCAGTGPVRPPEGNGTISGEDSLGFPGGACSERQLAMVYSPHQCWRMLYSPDEALKRGTMFEELYKPLGGHGNE